VSPGLFRLFSLILVEIESIWGSASLKTLLWSHSKQLFRSRQGQEDENVEKAQYSIREPRTQLAGLGLGARKRRTSTILSYCGGLGPSPA
jgi:hypothetical protein